MQFLIYLGYILRYNQVLTFLKQKLHQSLLIYSGFRLGRTYISNLLLRYIQALTFLKQKLHQSVLIYSGFRLGRTYISNLHLSSPSESR